MPTSRWILSNVSGSASCGFEAHAKGLSEVQQQTPRDLSSLRTGIFAAGMLSATPIAERAVKTLSPLQPISGFGMTELWLGVALGALDDDFEHRTATSGYPGIGYELRIVAEDDERLYDVGEPGELKSAASIYDRLLQ